MRNRAALWAAFALLAPFAAACLPADGAPERVRALTDASVESGDGAAPSVNAPAPRPDGSWNGAVATGATPVIGAGLSDASAARPNADASIASAAETGTTAKAEAPWPADCEYRYTVRAHGKAAVADQTKYQVAPSAEYRVAYLFKAPWGEKDVQLLEVRGLIDNAKIVHHWNLFAVDDASIQDGEIRGGPDQLTPVFLGETILAAGVPGSQVLSTPPDVGIRVPSGPNLLLRLEVHYYNASNPNSEQDGTGVEFCVTTKKRAHAAAMHWLGTFLFDVPPHARSQVTSHCVPTQMSEPVHVISVQPHMHQKGVHAQVAINRRDGQQVTLFEGPYDFREQGMHRVPGDGSAPDVLIQPGETLTSTCTFENDGDQTLSYGESSDDEMCFMVLLAWPAGQLVNGSLTALIFPGGGSDVNCLEP